jgi:hypothetical protein
MTFLQSIKPEEQEKKNGFPEESERLRPSKY